MPGNVALAVAVDVAPIEMCGCFAEERAYAIPMSGPYADGRSQRRYDASTSRKVWSLSKRLDATDWATVSDWWDDMRGALNAFYYYENADDHDPTGVSETGRALVRFDGALTRTMALARSSVDLRLIQVE